jgi:hypothetical protein
MSDQGYVQLDLIGDFDSLTDIGVGYMEDVIPGWEYNASSPDSVLIEGSSQIGSEVIDQAAQVPPEAMIYIGTTIYGIPIQQGTPAVAPAVITFADDTGPVVVQAQSQVGVPHPSGTPLIFLTDRDLVAPSGGGDISFQLVALDAGLNGNGAFGDCDLVEPVDGVESIVADTAVNGTDPETPQQYLDRLTDTLTLLNTHPILPSDHAKRARHIPGVGRATAIDLYMPPATAEPVGDIDAPEYDPDGAIDVPRCTTVAITDVNFEAPSADLKQDVYADLDANREVNFLNYVIGPTYTTIDVQAVVVPYPGFSDQDAIDGATGMVQTWLDPANWGAPPGAGSGEGVEWANDNTVWLYEAVDWLNRGGGVYRVKSVQMRIPPNAFAAADIALPGIAPLPQAGTITITAAES